MLAGRVDITAYPYVRRAFGPEFGLESLPLIVCNSNVRTKAAVLHKTATCMSTTIIAYDTVLVNKTVQHKPAEYSK